MSVNHKISTPLYKQVKTVIKKMVEQGELKPDEQIPSEREICDLYHVSRTTARQAISEAVNEGILYRVPGKGTFVAKPKIDQGLFNISSFEDTVKLRGMNPYTRVLFQDRIPADFAVAKALDLEVEEDVVHLALLGYADDEPVACYHSYLPVAVGKIAATTANIWAEEGRSFSTYQLYAGHNGFSPRVTHQTFEAVLVDDEMAGVLKIPAGSPIFKVTSVIQALGNLPVEYKEVYYRGDKFKFTVSRRHVNDNEGN